jgi:hypothetical protein
VRGLYVAGIEVVVAKHRAPYRRYQHGPVLQPEVVQGFGNELMDNAVTAAGTVVRLVLVFILAEEAIVEHIRFLINDL